MSRPNALLAVALAALLVTAGCLGGATGPGANGGETTDSDEATVSFYVSDRPGAIDQFEHLNVTITAVGFHQADEGGDDANESDDEADELNESDDEVDDVNESDDEVDDVNESDDEVDDVNETDDDVETTASPTDANETTTSNTTTEAPDADEEDSESDDDESDAENESDDGGDAGPRDSEGWVTHEVDNRTVDLTELQGANASRLADFNVSEGEYDKVFVYIGEVEGTLNSGEEVDVHLPSSRLHINKGFTVERGSNVSFVFDIMVHEAGNSGRYILRPVIGESGTGDEVEIDDVDAEDGERGPPADAGPGNDDESDAENESDDDGEDDGLALAVDGAVRAGETVTLTVTGDDGAAVANATVAVDGETVGTTDADGTIELIVPDDAEELEVTVTTDDAEAEASWPVRGGGGQGGAVLAG